MSVGITITITSEEATWLEEHLREWWEGGYSGLEELDYWLPQVTLWRTLRDAGVVAQKGTE